MLHFNNIFNLLTSRLVYAKGATSRISDDPMAGVDLSQKAPDEAGKPAEKPAASKKKAKETAEEAQRKVQEEVDKRKAEYNKTKFELEVSKSKLEVEEKVDRQLGGLMNKIQESANQGELDFHYNRAVTTLMNMQHEISALKFLEGGVNVSENGKYAKELQGTMNDLTAKVKKMEADGHPEAGGLTFDQIIQIMIDARTDHYNSYPMSYFDDAKLQKEKELKEPGETDAELAELLGDESDKNVVDNAILAANEPEAKSTERMYASRGVLSDKQEEGARNLLSKITPAEMGLLGLDINRAAGVIRTALDNGKPVTKELIESAEGLKSSESNLIYGIAMKLDYKPGDNPAQLIYNEIAALVSEDRQETFDSAMDRVNFIKTLT